MPRLHDSVTICERCDTIISVHLVETCHATGCTQRMCEECRLPTDLSETYACSSRCQAELNAEIALVRGGFGDASFSDVSLAHALIR